MSTKVIKYFLLGMETLKTVNGSKRWQITNCGHLYRQVLTIHLSVSICILARKKLGEIGFPPNTMQKALNLWETLIGAIRERITIVCFTQNPNDMPMWAHYANEHKGFCVEYEIDDPSKLYPVFYTDKRLPAQAAFC